MQAECLIDRFGHTIDIYYTNTIRNSSGYNVYVYGRPLISSIEGNWDNSSISFNYYLSPYFAVTLQNYKSRFKILCDQAGNLDSTGNHRFYPTQIVNPNGNEINIHYESYSRRALNVYNPNSGSNNMDLFFDDNLRRIDKFTNYFVGEVRYQYQSSNALSIDMNPKGNLKSITDAVGNEIKYSYDGLGINNETNFPDTSSVLISDNYYILTRSLNNFNSKLQQLEDFLLAYV